MQINYTVKPYTPAFRGTYLIEKIGTENPSDDIFNMTTVFMRNAEFYSDFEDYRNMKMRVTCKDRIDKKIETYMLTRGIKFKKYTDQELYGEDEILARIVQDPHYNTGTLRTVDAKKFIEMYKETNPVVYIAPCEKDPRQQDFKEFLKSGQDIYSPTVCINNIDNEPCVHVCDGRHRIAVFEGMGTDKIKINFLGEDSVRFAEEHGLIID